MLHPKNLKIDNRSIQQKLLEMLSYYEQLPFIENGKEVGKWDALFKDQLLFLWVEIHQTNLAWWQKERETIIHHWQSNGQSSAAPYLSKLIRTFYRWKVLAESHFQTWILDELYNCVRLLNFRALYYILQQLPDSEKVMYELDQLAENLSKNQKLKEVSFSKKEEHLLVEQLSAQLLNCLLQVQKNLNQKNWDELVSTENHPPHIGMLYGFLKAYEKVQNQLNTLPKRHLDFYYKSILQQDKRAVGADDVYVFFKLKEEVETLELPKGTKLLAGTDPGGKALEYGTKSNTYLNSAEITDLKTLLVEASPYIAPLNRLSAISGIYQADIEPTPMDELAVQKTAWKLFGSATENKSAAIGWAWASPVFLSSGGQRSYQLQFECTASSAKNCRLLLQELAKEDIQSEEELFFNFFHETLELRISGTENWFSIESYTTEFLRFLKGESNSIQINFQLKENDPAWVAYSNKVHGDIYNTNFPIVEILLKGDSIYYPYSFLKELEWERLGVKLEVEDFRDVMVYNKHGLVDTSSSFPLLGVNPLQHDSFYIGSKEWANKNITELDLSIDWQQLPHPNFKSHYEDYSSLSIADDSFKISIPSSTNPQPLPLFSLNEEDELLANTNWMDISLNKAAKDLKEGIELINPTTSPSAFVQFTLLSPEGGFGSNHYNEELILFSQRKARDRKNKLDLLPPKTPFVPYAKSIRLAYQCESSINLKSINNGSAAPFDFFHIHPHGLIKEADQNRYLSNRILPSLENRAYLYVGIKKLTVGAAFSLYFKIEESGTDYKEDLELKLEYLSGNSWLEVENDDILKNSIEGGQASGTLLFKVPQGISTKHSFYDSSKKWIRLSVDGNSSTIVGKCNFVQPNVARASRVINGDIEHIMPIKPGVVNGLLPKTKYIEAIYQPMPSFGGKVKELEEEFYQRISNQLGHKNRLVRPGDFKKMIFDNFDNISWVSVATASKYPKAIKAGEIHLVILPDFINLADIQQLKLKNRRLEEIWNFANQHCYPGIEIKVISPQIEQVEVYVDIILNRFMDSPSIKELTEIINKSIAPWAYIDHDTIENAAVPFNIVDVLIELNQLRSIYKVESCNAVQIIQEGERFTYIDTAEGNEVLSPSTYRSILIPAAEHKIRFIVDPEDSLPDVSIGNMVIGKDLIVREEVEALKQTADQDNKINSAYYLLTTNK